MVDEGHMPMDGIHYHKEPVLRVVPYLEQLVQTVNGFYEEHMRMHFDLPGLSILGHSHEVLVKVLDHIEVLFGVVVKLAHASSNADHLKELEDELILNPVFLKLKEVLTFLPEKGLSEAVAQLNAINPFVKVSLDCLVIHHDLLLL